MDKNDNKKMKIIKIILPPAFPLKKPVPDLFRKEIEGVVKSKMTDDELRTTNR